MADRFSKTDLAATNARFKMLAYYPSDPQAQAAILELLAEMVPHREALEWLTKAMVNRVGVWKGPAELRGVLCTKYRPADGVEMHSVSPGFTPADNERRYIEQHQDRMRLEAATPPPLALLEAFGRTPSKRVQ
jgi:hypothetical protein